MRRISPFFPRSHGKPRVDGRRVISGLIFVLRNGLRWRDAPAEYGPHKTLYNRFVRWSRMGVFERIFAALAAEPGPPERLLLETTHLKAHRPFLRNCGQPAQKGLRHAASAAPGGLNSKLRAVCDGHGRLIILLLSQGPMSDHKGPPCCSLHCRPPSIWWPIGATTAIGSARTWWRGTSPPAFPPPGAGRWRCRVMRCFTASATASRMHSAGCRTGAGLQPATIAALTPFSAVLIAAIVIFGLEQ
jgi:transposase